MTEEMLQETKTFYQQMYSEKTVCDVKIEDYVTSLPMLTENEADLLEGLITLEEASKVLKNMQNGKAQELMEWKLTFWNSFGNNFGVFVVRSLNEGVAKVEMSIAQKEGKIICLPKGDKPREHLKNWRPISLLNVTYKIGSSCIANWLKTLLPNLISEDQTGFVAGRYIGDNPRLLYMIYY